MMKTNTETQPAFIDIPDFGTLDPLNRAHVQRLIRQVDAIFRLSAKAYAAGTEGGHSDSFYVNCREREQKHAARGEALLAPLGIACDWPGLYPSFTIKATGYEEHTCEQAVLAALGHPRNWLGLM